ncbi:hypothetical protein RIF29_04439 [Crotalaria pallida]|uniref:DNA-directed RNA polymerase III subunit RPC9 n=1 Tax=Crotalaria pallida TaxID=3830 RepID=A0AAN9P9A0_CROPI
MPAAVLLQANAGALTNFEVLDFFRARGASKDPTRVIAKVAQSEYKVYDYLVNSPACSQSRQNINEFLEKVKKYDLAKAEILSVLNTRPAGPVDLFAIIEDCEARFPDEVLQEIIELVKKTLPPPPVEMDPEEIPDGNEETATLEHKGDKITEDQNEDEEEMDQGDEISEDQNDDGEQMDTS